MSQNDDTESCSGSSIGLLPLHLGQRKIPHSQTWTLVNQYNMEMRQQLDVDPFCNWKYDVQCQIANISNQIKKTFEDHPELEPKQDMPLSSSSIALNQNSQESVRQPTYKAQERDSHIQKLAVRTVTR